MAKLLVYERGRNKPLLLSLMDEFSLEIPITLGGPPITPEPGKPGPGDQVTLREYLGLIAYGISTPSSGFVTLTKKELIGIWAQENGAAHEDWSLDEPYSVARTSGLFIGGLPALAAELRVTTETVLHVGRKCLDQISPKHFELKDAERILRANPDVPTARFDLGIALANLGEHERALREFDQVISESREFVGAHNARGLALLHLDRLSEAMEAFQHAIQLDNNYADAHYNLACTYSRLTKFGECLDHLAKVKQLDAFKGVDPFLDMDLAAIRNDADYGPRFMALVERSANTAGAGQNRMK